MSDQDFAGGVAGQLGPAAGLLSSAQALAATLLGMLQTRMELLSTEVEEEWVRVITLLAIGFVGVLCLALGTVLVVALVVVAFWESYRLLAIASLALLFVIAGLVLLRAMNVRYQAKPRLFAASVEQLARDRAQLGNPDR
jgi:uncharacterized membrane protein YqjE